MNSNYQTDNQTAPQTAQAFMTLKYNGKAVPVSEEEAITLAQKGMNYDVVTERYEKAMSKLAELEPVIESLNKAAAAAGVGTGELLEAIAGAAEQKAGSDEVSMLRDELNRYKEKDGKFAKMEKQERDLEEFRREFPDVDVMSIDKDILDAWKNGDKSLIDVYSMKMYAKLKNEQNAKEANQENRASSTGSVKGAPENERYYTDEDIRKMSDEEIEKNFTKMMKQFSK